MKKELTYQTALEELETIVAGIENDRIEVDELLSKVERAAALIEICEAKLKKTDEEVSKIIAKMNAKD